MTRLTALFVLAGAGFVLSPATASAQFGYGRPGVYGPVIVPSFNPFFYVPQYRYQQSFGLNVPTMYGNLSIGASRYYYGMTNPAWALAPAAPLFYSPSQSYMSGSSVRPNFALEAQRDLARAQRAMGRPGATGAATGAAVGGTAAPAPGAEAAPNLPAGFEKVLAPAERAKVLSGEALNNLLAAIARAEQRRVDRPSAFVSPLQLEEVRFGGSGAAEALNLALRPLDFPAAFDDPSLKELRLALARDFAPLATALQAGKAPDPAKRAAFEQTLGKMEAALAPVAKSLPPADATAARKFMNQLAAATKALKGDAGNNLINPKWATEGTTIEELARHMSRHKLQFAAAPVGNEETYLNLHRNFATYLFLLTQPKK